MPGRATCAAPATSPSARRTAPVAWADAAFSSEAPMALAIVDSSVAAARALFEITGGQQDLDGRGEHSCPGRLCPRVEQNAAD